MGRGFGPGAALVAVLMLMGAAPAGATTAAATSPGAGRPAAAMPGSEVRPEADLRARGGDATVAADSANRTFRAVAPFRDEPPLTATPAATCDSASRPSPYMQGRVPADADPKGYQCNVTQLGHEGTAGGFKVERYTDAAGHDCAYYDTTLLFPTNAVSALLDTKATGTAVLDMSDPANPKRTATLVTLAMQSPHESLVVNAKRGLLAAVFGNPAFGPGIVDIYDVSKDCRFPELQSSSPVGIFGHESGFALDGRTFYATSPGTNTLVAIDVTNPKVPAQLWTGAYDAHGVSLSADGNRMYVAGTGDGLVVLDTSEIQARKPNPQVPVVSRLQWKSMTIPQNAMPVTIGGKKMLLEIDEYSKDANNNIASNGVNVGAGRIIDISDDTRPKVISNLRLAVNQPENRAAIAQDPGAPLPVQGYAGHYCGVPREVDPGIVACSFIASGLRVFDIRDPYNPKEIAYFVAPISNLGGTPLPLFRSNFAMSRPSFVPSRNEIWYSDGNSGFYSLRLSKAAQVFDSKGSTLGLPSQGSCVSRRSFTIRLRQPKGQRLKSAKVFVNGRQVKTVRGARTTARIDLRGLKKGTVTVRVEARTRSGKTIRETRRYLTCAPR
ncbi:hypothetical protein DSM112329_04499 [Paraconexibacter sp. AEG42_29]|uniref:YncE family protein n=1 Tax=Paraconexibacter sp. AEG42_29 TaxID=2997339 RepID=A0AAU7B171_9ACTN